MRDEPAQLTASAAVEGFLPLYCVRIAPTWGWVVVSADVGSEGTRWSVTRLYTSGQKARLAGGLSYSKAVQTAEHYAGNLGVGDRPWTMPLWRNKQSPLEQQQRLSALGGSLTGQHCQGEIEDAIIRLEVRHALAQARDQEWRGWLDDTRSYSPLRRG